MIFLILILQAAFASTNPLTCTTLSDILTSASSHTKDPRGLFDLLFREGGGRRVAHAIVPLHSMHGKTSLSFPEIFLGLSDAPAFREKQNRFYRVNQRIYLSLLSSNADKYDQVRYATWDYRKRRFRFGQFGTSNGQNCHQCHQNLPLFRIDPWPHTTFNTAVARAMIRTHGTTEQYAELLKRTPKDGPNEQLWKTPTKLDIHGLEIQVPDDPNGEDGGIVDWELLSSRYDIRYRPAACEWLDRIKNKTLQNHWKDLFVKHALSHLVLGRSSESTTLEEALAKPFPARFENLESARTISIVAYDSITQKSFSHPYNKLMPFKSIATLFDPSNPSVENQLFRQSRETVPYPPAFMPENESSRAPDSQLERIALLDYLKSPESILDMMGMLPSDGELIRSALATISSQTDLKLKLRSLLYSKTIRVLHQSPCLPQREQLLTHLWHAASSMYGKQFKPPPMDHWTARNEINSGCFDPISLPQTINSTCQNCHFEKDRHGFNFDYSNPKAWPQLTDDNRKRLVSLRDQVLNRLNTKDPNLRMPPPGTVFESELDAGTPRRQELIRWLQRLK